MKPNFREQAKQFAATYAVKLSDTQWNVFVEKLAAALEHNYTLGCRDGKNS